MTKSVELNIPRNAAERTEQRAFNLADPVGDSWLEQLEAHIGEGGLIGEAAGVALLGEVNRLRKVFAAIQPVLVVVEKLSTALETSRQILRR